MPKQEASGRRDDAQLLADDPVGGCLLGVPGLQQLFGDALEVFRIGGCINGAAKPLDFKALADR